MKKIIIIIILLNVMSLSASGQVYDTLCRYNTNIIIETTNFIHPPIIKKYDDGYSRQYVYKRSYSNENQVKKSAAYIWLYTGPKLYGYMFEDMDYHIYFKGFNKYGGEIEKCCCNGLYFRHDTYLDGNISVTYYFVRKEDLDFFERIMDKVVLLSD